MTLLFYKQGIMESFYEFSFDYRGMRTFRNSFLDICEHINFKLYFAWQSAILVLSIADYFFGGFYGKYFEVTGWN